MTATSEDSALHETKVSMQGMFEHKPLWYWRCTCGDQGTMLTTDQAAIDEAASHLAAVLA